MVASNNFRTADAVSFSTLVAVKVLSDDGTAAFANILAGIIYAADPGSGNVDIINMSLGGLGPKADYSHLLGMINRAIDWANSNGVLVVCSGGNDAFELDHNGNVTTIPAMSGNRIAAVQTW